jgi:AraC-like DNA-binding protein
MNRDEPFAALERAARTTESVRITNRTTESVTLQFKNEKGTGRVRMYALFPGIFLGFNDVETNSFPRFKGELTRGFKINFCLDGRCEVKMADGMYLFLEKGDLSFNSIAASGNFFLPYERYHGIELHIYDSALKKTPPLLSNFGIDLNRVCEKLCPASGSLVVRADEKIKTLFMTMAKTVAGHEPDYLRLKTAELLFLLAYTEMPAEKEGRNFFTLGQVKIAKQVMKIITADLSERHPVEKLAEKFNVSPSSLNKYFHGVYGESIPACLRDRRMNKAAEYLEKSGRQIADIALITGYENASKFAAVFKAAKGESPLEYRRRHRASS